MLNYIRSEIYRILHSRSLYIFGAVLCGIVLLTHIALIIGAALTPDFAYNTVRFSLNNFVAQPFIMVILGAAVAGVLFNEDRKSGVLKTTVAYGISRESILIGKCIVSLLTALLLLLVVFIFYVACAFLTLREPEWLPVQQMLLAIAASLPSAVASLIFANVIFMLCRKEITGMLWWVLLFYGIPMACFLIGLKSALFARIAEWMPYNFLRMDVVVSMNTYNSIWDTAGGMLHCIAAGVIGCVIFLIWGVLRLRRLEL
ncbi:hypothetical protein BRYFOR_06837 [Marvinbryantia formatexigens DSM 14469]|uniref:ABC-2 type transporter n=1 Tax=Marvinbryantia formatexigens DSM 14469 TaxID=478749 RepID=C6LDY8_9FIRM|nr:ABC transporter permease [Marvinbryantia formatexigens]EET61192.1 hypothetical protein BRYFOR_06837 [Marvinbryantia formatexigens DSM 14469]UWO23754.1 ABC transporter permease [Marvinbryantia formatexigens DSM 14469]SDF69477.1 ABC-2 family transporter protein [Marvinbryantia formatexigens]